MKKKKKNMKEEKMMGNGGNVYADVDLMEIEYNAYCVKREITEG